MGGPQDFCAPGPGRSTPQAHFLAGTHPGTQARGEPETKAGVLVNVLRSVNQRARPASGLGSKHVSGLLTSQPRAVKEPGGLPTWPRSELRPPLRQYSGHSCAGSSGNVECASLPPTGWE